MLQPCHVVAILLVYVCVCPDRRLASLLLCVFVHTNLGTFLALATPDTRDYYRRNVMPEATVANFFAMHWLLALVPAYYEWGGVLTYRPGPYAMLVGYAGLGLLHWTVLLPASLAVGSNINYVLSPPAPLRHWGACYRSWQTLLVYPMLAFPGLVLSHAARRLRRWFPPPAVDGAATRDKAA
mmetsp:Transcript_32869/g.87184  ORF Transcript_32869/g.87184 Transcript_32869/m.87184 type:complete len:182 (-) Transcript_32869:3-548(-)